MLHITANQLYENSLPYEVSTVYTPIEMLNTLISKNISKFIDKTKKYIFTYSIGI